MNRDIADLYEQAREKITAANLVIAEAEAEVREQTLTAIAELRDDPLAFARLIRYLYWFEPLCKTEWLLQATGLVVHDITKLAGTVNQTFNCSGCGTELEYIAHSMAEFLDNERKSRDKKSPIVCRKCWLLARPWLSDDADSTGVFVV